MGGLTFWKLSINTFCEVSCRAPPPETPPVTPRLRPSLRTENAFLSHISVYKVVLQKSIPTQIRQLVLYISNNEGQVDGYVRGLTFVKRRYKRLRARPPGTAPVAPALRPSLRTENTCLSHRMYVIGCSKSTPLKNRQLIVYHY